MSLLHIVARHGDALLVSFNELLHPLPKRIFFGCSRSHFSNPGLSGQPMRTHFTSSCIMAFGDLYPSSTIATTCANVICGSSLIKAFTIWVDTPERDFNGRTHRLSYVTLVQPAFKSSYLFIQLSLIHDTGMLCQQGKYNLKSYFVQKVI